MFKGQLGGISEIEKMSFRKLFDLRNNRIKRYNEDAKKQEEERKNAEKERIKNSILNTSMPKRRK